MAMVRWTKVRGFAGAVFAIVVLIAFVAIATALFGIRLPVLAEMTDAIGIGRGE